MSIWTHVIGSFRIDGIPDFGSTIKEIKTIIGPTNLYAEDNQNSTLPAGSEGSLRYSLEQYQTGLPWLLVSIWGDLRNFDEEKADTIEKWFTGLLMRIDNGNNKGVYMIRDAILKVYTETGKGYILYLKDGAGSNDDYPFVRIDTEN